LNADNMVADTKLRCSIYKHQTQPKNIRLIKK
jgi:hypothetical protein